MPRVSVKNLAKLMQKGTEEQGLKIDFHVDSRGSDDNEGGKLDPFKTFNKAMEVAREVSREVWVTIWFDPSMPNVEDAFITDDHFVINRQRLNIRTYESGSEDIDRLLVRSTNGVKSVYVGNATYESYVAWYDAGGSSVTIDYTAGAEAYSYTGQSLLEDGGLLVADPNWIDDTDEDNARIWINGMYFITSFNCFFVAADNTASGDLDFLRFTRCAFSGAGTNNLVYFGVVDSAVFDKCYFFVSPTSSVVFDNSLGNIFKDCDGFSSTGGQLLFVNHDGSAYQGTGLSLTTGVFKNQRATFSVASNIDLGGRTDVAIWNLDTANDLYFGSGLRRVNVSARSFTCVGRIYFIDTDSYNDGMTISARNFTVDRRNLTGTPGGMEIAKLNAENVTIKQMAAGDVDFYINSLFTTNFDVDSATTAGRVMVYGGQLNVINVLNSAGSVTVIASAL